MISYFAYCEIKFYLINMGSILSCECNKTKQDLKNDQNTPLENGEEEINLPKLRQFSHKNQQIKDKRMLGSMN